MTLLNATLGTLNLTHCITQRNNVKMVVQINPFKHSSGRAYGLGNISNILDDCEVTHGMKAARDYAMVVVLHSPGGLTSIADIHARG